MVRRLLARLVLAMLLVVAVPIAAVAGAKAYRWANYVSVGDKGIVEVEPVSVRGVNHYLFLRARDRQKPVLLFLPGGPGESMVPLAQEFTEELQKHFVVAHVESGVGKAEQYKTTPSLTDFVADAEALVDHLRSRFGGQVYLVGHSLGSVQALMIAQRSPSKIAAVATIGQTVDWPLGNRLAAEQLRRFAAARGDRATERKISSLPPTLTSADDPEMIDFAAVKEQRGLLRPYGMENVIGNHTAEARWWAYLTAPTHTVPESCNLMYEEDGVCAKIGPAPNWWHQWSGLIPGILKFNAVHDVPKLRVPYTAIVGENDWITPAQLTRAYVTALEAPSKTFFMIKGAGHYAHLDKPSAIQQVILESFGANKLR